MGLWRSQEGEVFDEEDGEISRRGEKECSGRRKGGRIYVLGLGARNICCTERSRGQVKVSTDWAPEYPSPQAEQPARNHRREVTLL